MVGSDVHDVPRVVERIEATYARATWVPAAERLWTLTPPPGWPPRRAWTSGWTTLLAPASCSGWMTGAGRAVEAPSTAR